MSPCEKRSTRREAIVLGGLALGASALAAATEAEGKELHPHIHHAIEALREARQYLKGEAHDFGGHRAKAIELIDKTIEQLELCRRYQPL